MRSSRPAEFSGRTTLGALAVLLAFGAAACSSHTSGQPAAAAPPMTLDQLATKAGCKIQSRTNATEVTQGACQVGKDRHTLLTFKTDQDKGSWLNEAKPWGGTYLVGTRWVVVGTEQNLEPLQGKLGGDIQAGEDHSNH